MNEDCVHDPVNRVCYRFEPRGDDLVVHARLHAGGGLPAHFHPLFEERWSVVEGEALFRLDKERSVLRPADGEVVVRRGVVHGLSSTGDQEARLRCHVSPALRLQAFLEESAAAAREGLFTARGIPRGLRGARWGALPQAVQLGNGPRLAAARAPESADRALGTRPLRRVRSRPL